MIYKQLWLKKKFVLQIFTTESLSYFSLSFYKENKYDFVVNKQFYRDSR